MRGLAVEPVTPERWSDLERLFGAAGAYSGCWCMFYRMKRADFDAAGSAGRKRAMRKVVAQGPPPGLLAYVEGEPVAWVAVAPREATPVLERSRVMRSPDGKPAWAITCFFVAKPWRGKGLMRALVRGAEAYAREQGATLLEAWPQEPRDELEGCSGYVGITTSFLREGWRAEEKVSPTRVRVRKAL